MDSNKIDELLARYWDCETSLEEEQQLREYFRDGNYPERHRETAALFRYFHENKKKTLSDAAFEKQVIDKIQPAKKGKLVSLVYNAMRIAAGLAVLVIAFYFAKNELRKSTPQEIVDTYDDPKLAFEETKKALRMISSGFGKAEVQARKINLFNEAQQEIQKENEPGSNL